MVIKNPQNRRISMSTIHETVAYVAAVDSREALVEESWRRKRKIPTKCQSIINISSATMA